MRVRRPIIALGAIALSAALAIGVVQAGDSTDDKESDALSRARVAKPLPGAPPALAALRERINDLQDGGAKAFDAQLRALRGYPVVVNAWASWCDPCEYELPFFQRQALRRGAKVAFIGINVRDDRERAQRLAASYPMPYPSFRDRKSEIIERFSARGLPVTVFYDADGKRQMVHQGVFPSEHDLSEAIDRYAVR